MENKTYTQQKVIDMVTQVIKQTRNCNVSKGKLKGFTNSWLVELGLVEPPKPKHIMLPKDPNKPTWDELKPELEAKFGKLSYFNNKRKTFRMVKIYQNEKTIFRYLEVKYPELDLELQDKDMRYRNDYFKGCIIRFK